MKSVTILCVSTPLFQKRNWIWICFCRPRCASPLIIWYLANLHVKRPGYCYMIFPSLRSGCLFKRTTPQDMWAEKPFRLNPRRMTGWLRPRFSSHPLLTFKRARLSFRVGGEASHFHQHYKHGCVLGRNVIYKILSSFCLLFPITRCLLIFSENFTTRQ
jgi:hypothetical protein